MNHEPLHKVFIGYDPSESVAWHTMAHSIMEQSSIPVALIPVNYRNFVGFYSRDRDPKQSNEFSFTRFLVPFLSGFSGTAVFFDCDMMMRDDISRLFEIANENQEKALHVVKHTYEPRDDVKYLDTVQYKYPRKNWSSVVVWNCSHPKHRKLVPQYVSTASGLDLHRFTWLDDEDIGELDIKWNWLVGEYDDPPKDVKNVHWTIGGPYFNEYRNADYAEEWFAQFDRMKNCDQRS